MAKAALGSAVLTFIMKSMGAGLTRARCAMSGATMSATCSSDSLGTATSTSRPFSSKRASSAAASLVCSAEKPPSIRVRDMPPDCALNIV